MTRRTEISPVRSHRTRAKNCCLGFLMVVACIGCSRFGNRTATRWSVKNGTGNVVRASYESDDDVTFYVVGHGWHTGLVLPRMQIEHDWIPQLADFPTADFVEVGWGDEGFYRAEKITAGLVAKAAFWPTPSVLHLVGFNGSVGEMFQHSDIVELRVNRKDFAKMCQFVGSTFNANKTAPLGPGLYGDSLFYRANGKYYAPKTCNVWTARALKNGGINCWTYTSMTAESVLRQARRFGQDLQSSPQWAKRAALGLKN